MASGRRLTHVLPIDQRIILIVVLTAIVIVVVYSLKRRMRKKPKAESDASVQGPVS